MTSFCIASRSVSHSLIETGILWSLSLTKNPESMRVKAAGLRAPARQGVGQLFCGVRGDEDDGAVRRLCQRFRLVDEEFHAVELAQEVVGKLDVGLVDLVDEEHDRRLRSERLPQHALDDVVADLVHAPVA